MSKLLHTRSASAMAFAVMVITLLSQPLSLAAESSPDFDGNGVVDISDFLLFVSAFGSQEGQEKYEAKYDLDSDGKIGIGDFLIFVDNFGKTVQSANGNDVGGAPNKPSTPMVVAASPTSLTVTWTAPEHTGLSITDYDVRYKESSGNFVDWSHTGPGLTTMITNLKQNTTYEVQVRAKNAEGTGEWSDSGIETTRISPGDMHPNRSGANCHSVCDRWR